MVPHPRRRQQRRNIPCRSAASVLFGVLGLSTLVAIVTVGSVKTCEEQLRVVVLLSSPKRNTKRNNLLLRGDMRDFHFCFILTSACTKTLVGCFLLLCHSPLFFWCTGTTKPCCQRRGQDTGSRANTLCQQKSLVVQCFWTAINSFVVMVGLYQCRSTTFWHV